MQPAGGNGEFAPFAVKARAPELVTLVVVQVCSGTRHFKTPMQIREDRIAAIWASRTLSYSIKVCIAGLCRPFGESDTAKCGSL